MTKIEILEYLQQNKSEFHSRYGVTKIGLFGSYARDQNNEESDIDIAVEFLKERKNLHTFLNLKREIETLLGKKVDLGIESALKPIVKKYVEKEIIYV